MLPPKPIKTTPVQKLSTSIIQLQGYYTTIVFISLVLAAFFTRIWQLQELSSIVLQCRLCVIPEIIKEDILFILPLILIFIISNTLTNQWISKTLKVIAVSSISFYVADIYIMKQFVNRIIIQDLIIYLAQPKIILSYLLNLPWYHLFNIATFLTLFIWLCTSNHKPLSLKLTFQIGALFTVIALTIQITITPINYIHSWATKNFITANLPNGINTPYQKQALVLKKETQDSLYTYSTCLQEKESQPHIILLILESWSTYHSNLWSGLNNWTPKLDEWAKNSIQLTQLHAGGYNTNKGLMSLFTGRDFVLPLLPEKMEIPFQGTWDTESSLPRQLKQVGYQSSFLTSGDLSFTRKDEWLKSIGFDYIEGHDHPAYNKASHHQLNSAPDDLLYNRSLDYLSKIRETNTPSFITIESISTHHPYIHPYTKEYGEEAVFRFMDNTVDDFIKELQKINFFDNGLLAVISDHRAMTMIHQAELQLFEKSSASRIPGFIIYKQQNFQNNTLLHQSDFLPTLINLSGNSTCSSLPNRSMLEVEKNTPRCVFHTRGDHRDHLDVFCPNGEGTVKIDGDNSHFIDSENIPKQKQQELLQQIAIERLSLN